MHTRDIDYVADILERREVLSEISTRDLVDELQDRLERRGGGLSKPKTYKCPYCGTKYNTAAAVGCFLIVLRCRLMK